jgi:hypothetical protein
MPQCRKYVLEREAEAVLGKVSPELTWEQVRAQVDSVAELYSRAGENLLAHEGLEIDLFGLQEVLGLFNPVRGINLLVYSNPDLDLRDLMSQPALQVAPRMRR